MNKHGYSSRNGNAPEYNTWQAMKARCNNPKHRAFQNYGGRGIRVCERWQNNFSNFMEDMGPKPTPDHTLERNNNDGLYEPSNCRWATQKEQMNNRRANHIVGVEGGQMCVAEAAVKLGINYSTLENRLWKGMSDEEATAKPNLRDTYFNFFNEQLTIRQAAAKFGIHLNTLRNRILNKKMPPEEAVTTKVRFQKAHKRSKPAG